LENVAAAIDAARALIGAGFAPFCPHLSYHVDPAAEIPHRVWMEVDLPWVEAADAVLRLPGESAGADIECERAVALGIPVFGSMGELLRHFRHQRVAA
jgi:hypothetical protein